MRIVLFEEKDLKFHSFFTREDEEKLNNDEISLRVTAVIGNLTSQKDEVLGLPIMDTNIRLHVNNFGSFATKALAEIVYTCSINNISLLLDYGEDDLQEIC